MTNARSLFSFSAVICLTVMLVGCGSDKPNAPLSAFQPEIVNNPDNFAFQATAVENVSTTVQYFWVNSGTLASVDHSSAVDSGTSVITVYDADGTQVYQSDLLATGTPSTTAGVAGNWRIRVQLTNCYGTLNFRVQKQ